LGRGYWKRLLLFIALVGCFGETTGPSFSNDVQKLGWADLRVKIEFVDPFEALEAEQLLNLSIVARVRRLKAVASHKVNEAMVTEADEAAEKLKEENVDIDSLLARREEIKQLRKKRATAMNNSLNGVKVKMPGYALPLEFDGKKVKEFLLVPWVGACIHTPPPPPNQIVYVKLGEDMKMRSRFEPVWVTGTLTVGALSKNLYLVDGSADINIGYSLVDGVTEKYEGHKREKGSSRVRKGDETSPKQR
jgi:uncharacterized protein